MNSLMSMRTIASVESNRNSASALHSSVLPTPVGPRNRNEPFGRFGSDKPARERRIASDTARTASSWPTTRLMQRIFHAQQFLALAFEHLADTGMPVQRATTSAISSAVTRCCSSVKPFCFGFLRGVQLFFQFWNFPILDFRDLREIAWRCAASMSARACSICSLIFVAPCTRRLLGFPDFFKIGKLRDRALRCPFRDRPGAAWIPCPSLSSTLRAGS